MNKLYEYIESLCTAQGITISEMCRQTGVARGSLSDLKSGRNKSLSAKAIYSIANYFGEDVNKLIALPTFDFEIPTSRPSVSLNSLLNDISRLAIQYGEDSLEVQKATEIEEEKKRITDDLRTYCRVDKLDYGDTTVVEQKHDRLVLAADILHTLLGLDDDGAKKLAERAAELEILNRKK